MILYAVNPETISALIAGGGTASAIGENLWEVQSAAPITPGPGYLVLPSADARLPALAAAKRSQLRTAAAEAQTTLLGDHGQIMRRLAEYSELLTLTTAGSATDAERASMIELIAERANSEAIDQRLAVAMAAVDAAEAANDRAALLAITW